MELVVDKASVGNVAVWLRANGYSLGRGRSASYQRSLLPGQPWPRFHLYVETADDHYRLQLHLDRKQESRHHNSPHAHNADYQGPELNQEVSRLRNS